MKAYWTIGILFLILLLQSPFTAQSATDTTQETLALKAGSACSAITVGPENSLQSGYATVAIHSGSAPFATAVMSYYRDGVVIGEVGVPASPPTLSARLFMEFRTNVLSGSGTVDTNTGISLVNMGTRTAQISLLLRNLQGDAAPIASGTIQLDAKAHLSKFINQLDPDFVLPQFFSSAIGFGSLEILSDQPLSIFALRMTVNQRGEPLFANIPVADLTSSLMTSPLYFPQIADGGGYQTTFLLLNTSDMQESGTLYFMKDDGSPYEVRFNSDEETVTQFHYTIQAKGALRILTEGSRSETTTGWAQLMPEEGPTPVGAGILGSISNGILVTESGVPSAAPTTHARIYIDGSSNHETGLAVVSSDNNGATVTLQAYQSDGASSAGSGPASIRLSANGHRAAFINQLISELPVGFTGILDLQSSAPFAALTLRSVLNSRNDFLISTFPAADFAGPAPAPIVFPQITGGDGYQTEFIFLNAGEDAEATLNWVGEEGSLLETDPNTTRSN
jgi:hypothetical protein